MRRIILPYLHPQKYVRALRAATRMAAWNVAFIMAGLLLIALAGEAYFRLTRPFIDHSIHSRFVDGVGLIREPNSELRYANWRDDNFVVSRVNSLGFLDREPVSAERAAAGCHIAFIGDSYVEAMEVPLEYKFQVRLEEMAARDLPHLGVTTQAYGMRAIGQIEQLPFYDEYARRLSPKLVVLAFYSNDFFNNSPALQSLYFGADPDKMPYMSAQKNEHGVIELRPPDAEYERFLLPRLAKPWRWRVYGWGLGVSYLAKWVDTKASWAYDNGPEERAWMATIGERPCCASLGAWQAVTTGYLGITHRTFEEEPLPLLHEEALEYAAFGIDQFKRRTDRDGASLAILFVGRTNVELKWGNPLFDRLNAIAEEHGIPVISEPDYIFRHGHNLKDGRWRLDRHWNAVGHQWAAEAVLEWLKANRGVCE